MASARTEYFEHDADVGIVGRGQTLEEAFENAAQAVFAIAAGGAEKGTRRERVTVEFEESDQELALVAWLNALIAEAGARGLALSEFRLRRDGSRWYGEAAGQRWVPGADRGTEVKGATLTMLSVVPVGQEWEARCVVDV